jgi:SPP1 gp7 family putative phage head morphogenesis protein
LNLSLGESLFKRLLNVSKNAFKQLHKLGSYKPEDLKTEKTYQTLIDETYKAFNTAIIAHEMPETMRKALQSDAFLFGGLKTHAQLFEASKLLLDDNGNLKPFNSLEKEFDDLGSTYNRNYLAAEYEFASNASQMAAKWEEFSDNDRYELQYRTAGDNRVRDSHDKLRDTTLPKSDPFWSSYTPPNGWNCRCTVVEVLKDKFPKSDSEDSIKKGEAATTQLGKNGKNKLEIFRFNPGADKKLFPPKHPNNMVAGAKVAEPIILTMFNKQYNEWKVLKSYKNGGSIESHSLVDVKNSDYKSISQCCNYFAKTGAKTEILPKVHFKSEDYKTIYKDLIGTKYEGKCPDFRVDGKYYELEGFEKSENKNKASKMLTRGLKQSNRIVIEDDGSTENHLKKLINFRIKEGQEIEEVWVKKEGVLQRVY